MWISRTQALITRILFRLRREILSVFVLQQVFEICFAGKSLHSCLLVQCQTQARLKAFLVFFNALDFLTIIWWNLKVQLSIWYEQILSRLVNSCFVYLSYILVCEEDRNSYFMPCVSWNVKLTFFVWVGHSPQTVLTLSRCILNPSPFALDYFSFSVISTLGDVMLRRKRFEISLCGLNQAWGRFIRIYGYHWRKKITSFQGPTLRKVHKNEKRKFTSMQPSRPY